MLKNANADLHCLRVGIFIIIFQKAKKRLAFSFLGWYNTNALSIRERNRILYGEVA